MGQPVTPAADIYALGAVAYHCVAGFPPFGGEDAVQIALRHIQDSPQPLPDGTSPALRNAITRAMDKVPANRFPTASAFAAALTAKSSLDSTRPLPPLEAPPAQVLSPRRDNRRRGALVTILAALALMTLGGLLIAANLRDTPTGESPVQPPAAPASNQPGPTPLVTEQVRRSTPPATPSGSRTPAPSATRPSPASTANTPTPAQSPAEPTSAPATSSAPELAPSQR